MKRYRVEMNDGDYVQSFESLEEAKECKWQTQRNYISRWCVIYDCVAHKYV